MTAAIVFDRVSKRYRLGSGQRGMREALVGLTRQIRRAKPDGNLNDEFWALGGVSFSVERGQALGVIGPNGAGKTTVLKILASITRPTSGSIHVQGRMAALIELGAGFHPDMTGRENVFMNGSILGMSQREIARRFDAIVAFAELEKFIDTPVKRYSSGMYARLGFAVAAHVEPDVLLVDEVLSVGDTAFQLKCFDRMDELLRNGTTLVFVSHNLKAVQQVCTHAIVLHRGQVAFQGPAANAVAEYANVLRQGASAANRPARPESRGLTQLLMTHAARIEHVEIVSADGYSATAVKSGDHVRVRVGVRFFDDAPHPVFACTFRGESGEIVYDTTTRVLGIDTPVYRAGDYAVVEWRLDLHLLDGLYSATLDLAYSDLSCYYDYLANAVSFVVTGASQARGIANLRAEVGFEDAVSSRSPEDRISEPTVIEVHR